MPCLLQEAVSQMIFLGTPTQALRPKHCKCECVEEESQSETIASLRFGMNDSFEIHCAGTMLPYQVYHILVSLQQDRFKRRYYRRRYMSFAVCKALYIELTCVQPRFDCRTPVSTITTEEGCWRRARSSFCLQVQNASHSRDDLECFDEVYCLLRRTWTFKLVQSTTLVFFNVLHLEISRIFNGLLKNGRWTEILMYFGLLDTQKSTALFPCDIPWFWTSLVTPHLLVLQVLLRFSSAPSSLLLPRCPVPEAWLIPSFADVLACAWAELGGRLGLGSWMKKTMDENLGQKQ